MPGGTPDHGTEASLEVSYGMPGTYPITLTTSNANGPGTTYTELLVVDVCMDVSDTGIDGSRMYPVPADNTLTLEGPCETHAFYTILDATGRSLRSGTITARPMVFETGALANGTYFLVLTNANTKQCQRFTIAHR